MEIERDEFIECKRGESVCGEKEYRNGYYKRTLRTCFGLIRGLKVPRTRSGRFYPSLLEKGKHIASHTAEGIARMYLRGVSTHKVADVLEGLLGFRVSSSFVSTITKKLDQDVKAFFKRRIGDTIKILILDGIYLRSKNVLGSRKRPVLVAYGIHDNGRRELLHFRLAKNESEQSWTNMLNELYNKGLVGDNLELICSDGCPGLIAAIETVYPYTNHQLCWAHKMRNVTKYCKKEYLHQCKKHAQNIYYAKNKKAAVAAFKSFKRTWETRCPKAVKCIEKDLERLLAFFDLPSPIWKKVRTTNVIERIFGEVRRRTKIIGAFPNDQSAARMIYALFAYFNSKWVRKTTFINLYYKNKPLFVA